MRYVAIALLTSVCCLSWAGVLPNSAREELLKSTLSMFWGHAKLSDGSVVQPENEQERRTLPVSRDVANQVLDVGELSGLAMWCGLDWQSHYLSMTAATRKNGFNEKQVAFIGVLHGAAQGIVVKAMELASCGASDRIKVMEMMQHSTYKRFLR